MTKYRQPIQANPLLTREDVRQAFVQLGDPLLPYYSTGGARLRLGETGASYSADIAEFEGFSRVLWGLAPLLGGGGSYPDMEAVVVNGIRNGTNPGHEEYWGKAADNDQRLVEMAAFGVALALAPERIWEPLNEGERAGFAAWLDQINHLKCWDCNWLFFAVMVNLGLKRVGAPYNKRRMDENLQRIDSFYLEDGWYMDGEGGHCDYYAPFALHYYGLVYAKLMETDDPARSRLYRERAELFAKQFIHWFSRDGSALPYGRSLSYRFAQSAFWGAAVYAGIEPFPFGVMKGILLRNLRWWFRQPIFHPDGTLSIGYRYPNLVMAENYNSPGSPYWALKSFLPLVLQEDHPFWQTEEMELPELEPACVQKAPHLTIVRQDEQNHILAFNSGHRSTNEHTHTFAKYEKFVYSNVFGFSVPRASWGLGQGAYDSMLALSEGDNLYRVKRTCTEQFMGDDYICMKWRPWTDVFVRTWLVPGTPWHVRIHAIETARVLDAAEGGFALGLENREVRGGNMQTLQGSAEGMLHCEWGASGMKSLYGYSGCEFIYPNANTNLMHARTVIPTLTRRIAPDMGTAWLVSAVFGEPDGANALQHWNRPPKAEMADDRIIVYDGAGKEIRIPLLTASKE